MEENPSVTLFRDYLRIKSVQPKPDYDGIVKFLQDYAEKNEFPYNIHEPVAGKPIVVITFEGTNLNLSSILLNSHTDVVPVFPENWIYDPFTAHKTDDGKIYGRGSQDMKCVGIQYLEAVRMLKSEGVRFLRTVHMSFVPDEEIGEDGLCAWLTTDSFKKLNVGFALDEGLANPGEEMRTFYAERTCWWGSFVAEGSPGHGSQFLENTVGVKIKDILNKIYEFRDEQEKLLKSDDNLLLGDVSTINATILSGGIQNQNNVIPNKMEVGFDLRVSPHTSLKSMLGILQSWSQECDVKLVMWKDEEDEQPEAGITSTADDDPWWSAMTSAAKECDVKFTKEVFPACTDSRHLRNIGIPAIGFSPMNHTPILLHDHNEYLDEDVFIKGIDIFKTIIMKISNVAEI